MEWEVCGLVDGLDISLYVKMGYICMRVCVCVGVWVGNINSNKYFWKGTKNDETKYLKKLEVLKWV